MTVPGPPWKSGIVWLLGGLAGLGAASLDMYLPSLPSMEVDLHVGRAGLQATITACMIGLALGQLLLGTASDRWGRRPVLIAALGSFVVGSGVCALAPTLPVLIGARVLQGLGAGASAAIARAVARDLFDGRRLVSALGLITSVMAVAPIAAPLSGAVIEQIAGWRAVFLTLACGGLLLSAAVFVTVAETRGSRPGAVPAPQLLSVATLRTRSFWTGAGAVVCTSAALFAYLGSSSFLLQQTHGLSPQQYGLDFGLNAVGLLLGAWCGRAAGERLRPVLCVRIGVALSLLGGGFLAIGLVRPSSLPPVLIGFLLITTGHGWASPPGIALAMMPHPERAGSISAWFGALQYGGGASVVLLAGPSADVLAALTASVVIATAAGMALTFASRNESPRSEHRASRRDRIRRHGHGPRAAESPPPRRIQTRPGSPGSPTGVTGRTTCSRR